MILLPLHDRDPNDTYLACLKKGTNIILRWATFLFLIHIHCIASGLNPSIVNYFIFLIIFYEKFHIISQFHLTHTWENFLTFLLEIFVIMIKIVHLMDSRVAPLKFTLFYSFVTQIPMLFSIDPSAPALLFLEFKH
jgi:hypothetical protein